MTMTYDRILDKLNSLGQYMPGTGVDRAEKLLRLMDNPERRLKVIHVAGTNGKGSTCAYLNNMLMKTGYSVGLFTSPHLVDIRERIRIDGEMIDKADFVEAYAYIEDRLSLYNKHDGAESPLQLAYFDYLFGIAMYYFNKKNVDYVINETGLGGRLDATNAVERPVLSIITTISLEHTAILGDTVERIAAEKAGIIKSGIPVVYWKEAATCQVFEETAKSNGSRAVGVCEGDTKIVENKPGYIDFLIHNEYYNNDCFQISNNAVYQVYNVSLALTAYAVLRTIGEDDSDANAKNYNSEIIAEAVKETCWPGRMEKITDSIIVDGAHNPQGIKAFACSVEAMYHNNVLRPAVLLFSVVSDKNYDEMIGILTGCHIFKEVLVTVTGGARKLSADTIVSGFVRHGMSSVHSFEDIGNAMDYFRTECADYMLFAAGSLYLVGDIKRILEVNND